ncbi:MAG: hypothetical protein Kow0069_12860 [Promethearchaeota archaeon]
MDRHRATLYALIAIQFFSIVSLVATKARSQAGTSGSVTLNPGERAVLPVNFPGEQLVTITFVAGPGTNISAYLFEQDELNAFLANLSNFVPIAEGESANGSLTLVHQEPATKQLSVVLINLGDSTVEVAYGIATQSLEFAEFVSGNPIIVPNVLFFMAEFFACGLFVVFGFSFLSQGIREKENKAQKSYQKGLGLLVIGVAICQGTYVTDLAYRFFFSNRIFLTNEEWQAAGFRFDSIINRDYYLLIFCTLLVSLGLLLYPVEKYMLKRSKPVLAIVSFALTPLPLVFRFLEYNFEAWFGAALVDGSLYYYLVAAGWAFLILVIAIGFLVVATLYVRMARAAPPGSKLRRKCVQVVLGLILWPLAIFSTASAYRAIEPPAGLPFTTANWAAVFFVPVLLLASLGLLTSGFRRDY